MTQPGSNVADPSEAWRNPKRWAVFCLSAVLFTTSQFYRVSNAIIAPRLTAELGLNDEQLGLLGAAFFYAFALAQLPMAIVLDKVGGRRIMAALSLVGAAGALMFASAESLAEALAGRLLLGLGMAGNLMGTLKLLTRWFAPREFATLSGLIVSLGTFGNMMAATPLAYMVDFVGWRWTFACIGIFTALAAAAFYLVVRDDPPGMVEKGPEASLSLRKMASILFTHRSYWIISFGTFARYGTFVAIQGLWAGPYLMQVQGLSPVEAGDLLLLLSIGIILGSPLVGWISDKVLRTRKWVIFTGLLGVSAFEAFLAFGTGGLSPWTLAAALFLLGLFSACGGVMYAHIKEIMPEEMSGMAMTGINFFTMVGGGVFLHLMGMVLELYTGPGGGADPQGFQVAFLMVACAVLTAAVLYLFTKDSRP